jgi:oligopeptide transport system substrate-binding protein
MIKRGLADGGFFNVPSAEIGRLRDDPLWRQQLDVADGLNTNFVFMNTRVPPFNDVRVRQAVCWALDRRAFVKVYAGLAMPAYEFLPVGMPGVEPLHMYEGPDLDKARALLADAGFPHGFKTKLYSYGTAPIPRVLAIIQQQLAGAGIDVELDIGEAAGYTSMAGDTTNRIPFGFYGWTADYVDPSNFLDVLLNGNRITPKHNLNLAMFEDPDVDARMERAMVTLDDSLRTTMWNEIDRKVMEEAPIAVLYHGLESRLYHPRLGGWHRHITRILKLEKLYLKQPLATPAATAGVEPGSRRDAGEATAATTAAGAGS